jgi:hypothetical protein
VVVEKDLSEAEKMRRVPGIIFVDGATGRRARVAGALDVFEIIRQYRWGGYDRGRLSREFAWIPERLLDTAVAYYETFPDEIDEWLEDEERHMPDWVRAECPPLPLRRQ